MFESLPTSILQMGMIFLSIVIEALPFVLLGCLISGFLHVFLSAERVNKLLPKNKFLAIIVGSVLGVFFPSCECGIVPIVHQFLKKEVPTYTAFPFMLTAPIINPIVLFSTFIAFSNSWKFVLLRVTGSLLVALVVGIWLAYIYTKNPLKESYQTTHTHHEHSLTNETCTHKPQVKKMQKISHMFEHSIDEFFDTGRYLIIGALIASGLQVYLPTSIILTLGSTKLFAILVMLALAVIMSLCSEADAFIGSSLLSLFGVTPVIAFLVFGPMVDIKNLLMMKRYFGTKFIVQLVSLIAIVVTIFAWVV
ncbi:permease [Enterococcus bulliens]